jgi:hypothetical protein
LDRTDLTLVIAAALLAAVAFGWGLRWIYGILNRPAPPPPPDETELMAALRQADEARLAAEQNAYEIDQYYRNRLTQTEAELQAAMDTLGALRREAESRGG